jgi:hypothetical protein
MHFLHALLYLETNNISRILMSDIEHANPQMIAVWKKKIW